jgi:hypothetical protein
MNSIAKWMALGAMLALTAVTFFACATPSLQKIDDATTKANNTLATVGTSVAELHQVVVDLKTAMTAGGATPPAALQKVADALDKVVAVTGQVQTAVTGAQAVAHAATPAGGDSPSTPALITGLIGQLVTLGLGIYATVRSNTNAANGAALAAKVDTHAANIDQLYDATHSPNAPAKA